MCIRDRCEIVRSQLRDGVVHVRDGRSVYRDIVDLGVHVGCRQRVRDRVLLENVDGKQKVHWTQLSEEHRHAHRQPGCQRHLTGRRRSTREDSRHLTC